MKRTVIVLLSRVLKAIAIAVALAALTSAGCGADFVPYNRLETLRVLAVRAEPATAIAGQPTQLSALLYTPPGEEVTLDYAWTWCPVPVPGTSGSGYPCLFTAEMLTGLAPPGAVPPEDLGTQPTATFMHGVAPADLAMLCSQFQQNCQFGLPVQIDLTVTMRASDGTQLDRIRTVWTLHLPVSDSEPPNTNPRLDGLAALIGGQEQLLGDDPQVTLPRNQDTVLLASIPVEVIEPYTETGDDGVARQVRERAFLTWFTESGDTDSERTSASWDTLPLPDAIEQVRRNEWRPAKTKDYARDTASLVVVMRDNRGGVAWRSAAVRLGAAP